VLAAADGRKQEAADLWLKAWRMLPGLRPLAVECCQALLGAERPLEALELIGKLPPELARHGRVRLLHARASLDAGRPRDALDVLGSELVVPDVREGEVSLSDLWFSAQERRLAAEEGVEVDDDLRCRVRRDFPPPRHLDFRMVHPPE